MGKEFRWRSKRGSCGGRLVAVNGDELAFERDIIINKKRQGTTKSTVAIGELPASVRRWIFPEKHETEDAWFAKALHTMVMGRLREAESALSKCPEHPLHAAIDQALREEQTAAREREASPRWEAIVATVKKSLTQKGAKTLLRKLDAYEETYGKTAFALQTTRRGERARLRRVIEGIASGLDRRIAELLHGKIHSFNARTREIVIEYDCRDPYQTQDFVFIVSHDGKWSVTKEPGRTKEGLRLKCLSHWERSNNIQVPMLHSADFTARIRYMDLGGNIHVRLSFYQPRAKGSGARISFLAQNNGEKKTFAFHEHPWGGAACAQGERLKSTPANPPLPKSGELEIRCRGRHYSAKVNGRLVLEYSSAKPANRNGITLGGNGNTRYTITRIHLKGRLDNRWLKAALAKQERSKP